MDASAGRGTSPSTPSPPRSPVGPTRATHRRAPSWEGCLHSAGLRPRVTWVIPYSRIVSRHSPW